MTNQTFTVAGVSKTKNGQYKVRFANDLSRVKLLSKVDTDVNLIELAGPLTKPEVVTFLKTTDFYSNEIYRAAIDAADAKYNGTGVVRVNSSKKSAPSLESLKARAEAVVESAATEAAE
jgi:hypothetical protein